MQSSDKRHDRKDGGGNGSAARGEQPLPPLLEATFVTGAARWEQLPGEGPVEIAFAGRSNAGKSSAVNALARRTRLAFASRTPGRTQQINFFRMRGGGYVVDLPGYGYAAVARETKNVWQDFLWRYVTERRTLSGLVLVADIRRGVTELDMPLFDIFLSSARPVLLLATKADKFNTQERRRAIAGIGTTLRERYGEAAGWVTVIEFSATEKRGIAEADAVLAQWLR